MKHTFAALNFANLVPVFAVLARVLAGTPCRADLVMSAPNVTINPAQSSDFDITLVDTGGTFNIAAFSIELLVSVPAGVQFTGVDTNTSSPPYIFGTDQLPPFSFDTFPNIQFTALDADLTDPFFATLKTGDVVGLAHVAFSADSGASPGSRALTFVPSGTLLSDQDGSPVSFTNQGGSILVNGVSAVPEPGSLALLACGVGGILLQRRRSQMSVTR